jgi:hypothetical protein
MLQELSLRERDALRAQLGTVQQTLLALEDIQPPLTITYDPPKRVGLVGFKSLGVLMDRSCRIGRASRASGQAGSSWAAFGRQVLHQPSPTDSGNERRSIDRRSSSALSRPKLLAVRWSEGATKSGPDTAR